MEKLRKFPKIPESIPQRCFYAFGPFRVDLVKRLLLRGDEPVSLSPKDFDLLLALVQHHGEVLVKEELLEGVWPDTVVEEGNLNRHISTLRKTLGESPNEHEYIVTVPGRGYRFVAEVMEDWRESLTMSAEEADPVGAQAGDGSSRRQTGPKAHLSTFREPSLPISRPEARVPTWRVRSGLTWLAMGTVISLAAISLAAVGLLLSTRSKPILTKTDYILISDFTNTTGDPVFDDALKQAVSVQLTQSPYLNILSEARVSSMLKLMTKPSDTKLTPDVARDLCQRSGCKVYIGGSIARLGLQYVIGLNAINCRTGDSIALEQVVAQSKEQVLNALDGAAAKLRGRLGESLSTVREFDTPLKEATTPSLDALKAYSLGLQKDQENDAAAIPFFKRAIELDPEFASAYASLAVCYRNMGESGMARENFSKAFELRSHVSERERLLIAARYYSHVTGELQKAIDTFQIWIQAYPRDAVARSQLGSLYGASGQYEKSIAETQEALRLDPDSGTNYSNLLLAQAALDRLDDARNTFNQEIARKIDDPIARVNWFGVAFVRADVEEMDKQMAWSAGKPEGEDNFFAGKSDAEAYYGHVQRAREFSRKAVESAQLNDEKETAAQWQMDEAIREAEFGNREVARRETAAAQVLTSSHDTQILAALTLARSGDTPEAEKLANDLEKRYPLDTLVINYWLPVIRASVEIYRNNPDRAIQILQPAAPYELASPVTWSGLGGPLYPAYLRGESYLLLRQGSDAAAEYRKILDHRGFMLACPLGALARVGLARAYALQGDTAKTRSGYQDFFALWKDADPDVPILKQAKAEYAKLQ
jgi:DNA-binding winged helix-turn-helix (wHTH) protein/tetratricopeptide (TPR) repeat protein